MAKHQGITQVFAFTGGNVLTPSVKKVECPITTSTVHISVRKRYAVTSASESAGVLTINLTVNTATTSTSYGTDLSSLVVTVTKTESDSVRVKIVDKNNKRWEVPQSIFTDGTLGKNTHVDGIPIARPLLMEYPSDTVTHNINYQFMLGDAILVTPVVYKGAKTVTGYFPRGIWYNVFDYSQLLTSGVSLTIGVTLFDMSVHIRGGTILAMHQTALTTKAARLTPFDILVALPVSGMVNGDLYLDDGETIANPSATIVKFSASISTFTSTVLQNDYVGDHTSLVHKITVLGVSTKPSRISIGSISEYDPTTQRLEISLSQFGQTIDESFTVVWD